jgi:AcrR family transcriptional regulator
MFVRPADASDTKTRLRAAASALFAERGFHATKIRDIAERAGVNVAAGHYHYGSKKALYLEVLRAQFVAIRAELARRGASPAPAALDRMDREELAARLHSRLQVMLEVLLGPPPGLHGTLMQRELCDPSEALPVIVREFIGPMKGELADILARLEPGHDRGTLDRCVYSVFGQVLFYRFAMPAVLLMQGRTAYARDIARALADHVTEFSLGGLARAAGKRGGRRGAR